MERVSSEPHRQSARGIRQLLAAHAEARDLIAIGAYVRGSDPLTDRAVDLMPRVNAFLRQKAAEVTPFDLATTALRSIDPENPFAPEDADDSDTETLAAIGETP
jgi:flagellum-specific ATP synthase